MSTLFRGKGNLGNAPVLKHPRVDDEPSNMVEMYVYFDRLVPSNDGYEDRGGFWLNVEYWSDDRAERVANLLHRGCRISAEGTLVLNSWEGDNGPESRLTLKAKDITLDLARVASVAFTPKAKPAPNVSASHQQATDPEEQGSTEPESDG
jgi:single-strand DNA-binding protein